MKFITLTFEIQKLIFSISLKSKKDKEQLSFLCDLGLGQKPCDEYLKYTSSIDNLFNEIDHKPVSCSHAFKEFATYIANTDLDSDDVEGIRRLATSAHIGGITSGLYQDLPVNASAVEVESAIHEQILNFSSNAMYHGIEGTMTKVEEFLSSRKLNTPNVKQHISSNWKALEETENHFRSLLDRNLKFQRSVLTDDESFQLYASFFDREMSISSLDKVFIDGCQLPATQESSRLKSSFLSRDHGDPCASKSCNFRKICDELPVVMDLRNNVKSGFEQINDDFFARDDNKFIVFNRKGAECWNGPEAVTKLCSIHDDFTVFDPEYTKPDSFQ